MDYTYHTMTYTGVVRTFNWDKKYGFIDVIEPSLGDAHTFVGQVFVHVSQIRPSAPMRAYDKKLITGEIVRFEIAPSQDSSQAQRPQAVNVRGMYGLPLICEHGTVEFQNYTHLLQRRHEPSAAAEDADDDEAAEADDHEEFFGDPAVVAVGAAGLV